MLQKENLLALWLETEPTVRSPNGLYGHPPMWETARDDDLVLYTRPGKVMERPFPLAPYVEVDGVHYQWMRDGAWVGQGCQASFQDFAEQGASKIDVSHAQWASKTQWIVPPPGHFDWAKRTNQPVLDLPFTEGVPSPDKATALSAWVRSNSDLYAPKYVKMYHATDPSLPIEDEGLKPTSANRRRSYQSTSGYVYLAATPDRAKSFGDLGNRGRSSVYEVVVPVRSLLADRDQLNNQRAAGRYGEIGNSIGESIVYGGGVRVKGAIEPWAVRKMDEHFLLPLDERSLKEAQQIASKKGACELVDGGTAKTYSGPVIGITSHHVVQSVGRSAAVHRKINLEHVPVNGSLVDITYDGQHMGKVSAVEKSQEAALSR